MTEMTINWLPFLIDFIRSIIAAIDVISGGITLLVKLPLPVCSKILNRHHVTIDVTGGITGVKQTTAAQHVITVL